MPSIEDRRCPHDMQFDDYCSHCLVDEFNEWYPVGTPVLLRKDLGDQVATRVRSVAWDLCGTVVAKFEGISGGYDVSRVTAIEQHTK